MFQLFRLPFAGLEISFGSIVDPMKNTYLRDIGDLFNAVDRQSIRYCIWKSNEHLGDALSGNTDVDVLVDPDKRDEAERVLRHHRLIRLVPQTWAAYDDVDDWVGCDAESGHLYHLHVHYALRVGSKSLKNCRLPLESWALSDAELLSGVKVIRAEKELALLIIRYLVRNVTATKRLRRNLCRREMRLPESFSREMDWLVARTDRLLMVKAIEDMKCGASVSDIMGIYESYVEGTQSFEDWSATARRVRRALRRYRCETGVRHVGKKAMRYLNYCLFGVIAGKIGRHRRKKLSNGVMFVALIGADGSGKTTLANDLRRWLGWKIDVKHLYFGIPKASMIFNGLNGMNRILNHVGRAPCVMRNLQLKRMVQGLNRFVDGTKWCCLARRRLRLSQKASIMSRDGWFVLAERYPLKQLWDMQIPMDGPRICAQRGGVIGLLSRVEQAYYEQIGSPDRLYVLDAEMQTLLRRKQDMPQTLLADRVVAIRRLGACGGVVVVDANRDYNDVLLDLKSHIWDSLQSPLEAVSLC